MKNIKFTLILSALLLASFNLGFAQSKNVQNAAMDYNSYEKALANNNKSGAKRSILAAKSSIDEAATNPATAQDIKMLFYKGKIYMGLAAIATLMSDDEDLKSFANERTAQTGLDAWKLCYELDTKNKYRDDIKAQVMMIAFQGNSMGAKMFGEQKFQEAFELFSSSVKMYDIIGKKDQEYGTAAFNAGLSAERLEKYEEALKFFTSAEQAGYDPATSATKIANSMYALGKADESMNYILEASKKFPGNSPIIITIADLALKTGKDDVALQSLNQVIDKDPKNGLYHWAVGTVYQRMGKEDEAIRAYIKAAELSPNDDRAFYSLGTLHFNKAAEYMSKANSLKLNDPEFDVLEKKALEEFAKAAPYLERVIEISGDEGNKQTLNSLFTIYRALKNQDKALQYKKRAEAVTK
jgi:tetratricopeptide (TPR) repeat protein